MSFISPNSKWTESLMVLPFNGWPQWRISLTVVNFSFVTVMVKSRMSDEIVYCFIIHLATYMP